MNGHLKKALLILGATATLDVGLGITYAFADHINVGLGLYCATGFATTDGCPINPSGWLAYACAAIMMLTLIPLVGVVWAFVTTSLTANHIDKRHEQMKQHVTSQTNES